MLSGARPAGFNDTRAGCSGRMPGPPLNDSCVAVTAKKSLECRGNKREKFIHHEVILGRLY